MSSLHPKVAKFRSFVEKHPKLIDHVRNNKESWQPYYEKWILYGEDDPYWESFRDYDDRKETDRDNQELFQKLSNMMNNVDLNKLQEQMHQLNGVISNVQSVIQQFQHQKPHHRMPMNHQQQRPNPFKFGKD
ncbi:spore coat protein YlbD [Salinibacillus xinjiangensis]|uniref:Cytosolic protein n=1 Tax=Salinibacillus xinjiangensis TaxID=1229268 RepID=A0A6G1X3F5_9BACI|nr:spore coat protein YlbD [Salinibacillus xinjiangensis]MRG85521.1 hypothetical protein [Salinibacillus xinjiangensis]